MVITGVETASSGTCIGLKVLGGHHDHKPDGTFIPEHLIGPAADGAHTLDRSNAIVGNEHLRETPGRAGAIVPPAQGPESTQVGTRSHTAYAGMTGEWMRGSGGKGALGGTVAIP